MADMEGRLKVAWCQVLDMEDDELDSDSHFFEEGGDSVAAMRLITVAEGQKLTLDNGTIYDFPVLKDMASNSQEYDPTTEIDLPDITQLDEDLVQACAKACKVEPQAIEDIFPATKAQANLIAFHQKDGSFMPQNVFQIHGPAKKDRIREVFEVIRQKNQILRTRIVKRNDAVYQVVVKGAAEWYEGKSLSEYKNQVYSKDGWVKYGDPLFRYAFIEEGRDLYFAYTSQHAGYDGWTNHMIFDAFEEGLRDLEALRQKPVRAQYKQFTEWFERRSAKKDDVAKSMDYWRSYLEGFQSFADRFSVAPGTHMANPTGRLTKIMPFKKQASAFSLATMAHVAWAISLGNIYQHDDMLFWAVTSGRRPPRGEPLPGIESIMGPVPSGIHLRTRFRADQTIEDLVQGVQDHMIATIPHQRGVGHAREVLGPLYLYQTNFNWHSIGNDIPARVIDFENEDGSITRLEGRRDLQSPFKGPIPFVLDVWEHRDQLRVIAKWDQKLYAEDRVALMMDQLIENLRAIALGKAKHVGDLWKIQESAKNATANGDSIKHELLNGGLKMDEPINGNSTKTETVNDGPTINRIVNGDSMDYESVNGDSTKTETVNNGPTLNDMINGDSISQETINGDTSKEGLVNDHSTNVETTNSGTTINSMVYGDTVNHETINSFTTEMETVNGASANNEIIKGGATLDDLVNGDSISHETINGSSTDNETVSGSAVTASA